MTATKMYQVSTLQALALGYTRSVVDVKELVSNGDSGLGTFTGVDGEMILVDGKCYRAKDDGSVVVAEESMGVPFASVCFLQGTRKFELSNIQNIDSLKNELNNKIKNLY